MLWTLGNNHWQIKTDKVGAGYKHTCYKHSSYMATHSYVTLVALLCKGCAHSQILLQLAGVLGKLDNPHNKQLSAS